MNFSFVVDFLARTVFGSALFFGPHFFPGPYFLLARIRPIQVGFARDMG
jgi:hypothetical protein